MKELFFDLWKSKRIRWIMFSILSVIFLNTVGMITKDIEYNWWIYLGCLVLLIATVWIYLLSSLMEVIKLFILGFLDIFVGSAVEIVLKQKPGEIKYEEKKDIFNKVSFIILMILAIALNIFTVHQVFK